MEQTDHKPLQWLFSLKDPQSKLIRRRLKLEEYNYDIEYVKGKINYVAVALSRIKLQKLNINEEEEEQENIVDVKSDAATNNLETGKDSVHSLKVTITAVPNSEKSIYYYAKQVYVELQPNKLTTLVPKVFGKEIITWKLDQHKNLIKQF